MNWADGGPNDFWPSSARRDLHKVCNTFTGPGRDCRKTQQQHHSGLKIDKTRCLFLLGKKLHPTLAPTNAKRGLNFSGSSPQFCGTRTKEGGVCWGTLLLLVLPPLLNPTMYRLGQSSLGKHQKFNLEIWVHIGICI